MDTHEIIRALRCSASTGEHDCHGCPYLVKEKLSDELKKVLSGGDADKAKALGDYQSCDVDKIAMDAAEALERIAQKGSATL